MSLAKKFEFCTKYARATRYTLSLDSTTGKYICTASSLEDAYDLPATYSVEFVKAAIDCGNWIVTKNLDEVASEDRPLKFPFTVLHSATRDEKKMFEVTKGYEDGRVICTYFNDDDTTYENCFTEEEAKKYLKEGIWIVKHVGERVEESLPSFSISNGAITAKNCTITAPQLTESTTISTLKVVVECDTTEALANAKALAGAYEQLAMSMESVIALCKELREVV